MTITTLNPFNDAPLETYALMTEAQIDQALADASSSFALWRRSPVTERAQFLDLLARELEAQSAYLSELIVREMGKPLKQAQQEVAECVACCRFYAENGPEWLEDQLVLTEAHKSYISYQPLGVVLAIMPWNFPLWQAIRALVPAWLVGNTVVLKHSANTTGCALALERIVHGLYPLPILRTLILNHQAVAQVIADPRVCAVTLTGSTEAGRKVAAQAGQALKKVVLELGGSDAYVILSDAPIPDTARACVDARLINSGQSCIAAKRFIVTQAVADEFTEAFIAHMKRKVVGDPMSLITDVGPLARRDLRDELAEQVQASHKAGAKISFSGDIPSGSGAFFAPTVLTQVAPENPAAQQEMFGPVASILIASSEEHADALANDTVFGLGAAIWTSDRKRGEVLAREHLEAGCCFVNEAVKSDPRLPFGGIKDSGYGRELSELGLREFTNTKTVYVK